MAKHVTTGTPPLGEPVVAEAARVAEERKGKGETRRVVSDARKLIFRPEAGAPVVQFPTGAKVNDWGANNESPSVVVRNATEEEPSWQGVDHDSGVVIVNEVPERIATMVLDLLEEGGRTIGMLELVLKFLALDGYGDQYTSKLDFVRDKLSPAGRMLDEFTGIVKRDDRDLVPVWREGNIFFVAPGGKARVIERDILARTYRNADGTKLVLETVPEGQPEGLED